MKEVAGLKADMHLAAELGTTRANIAKWKSRNSIPFQEAIAIVKRYGGSLDYIILGKDPVPYLSNIEDFRIETKAVLAVLERYVDQGVIVREPGDPLPAKSALQIMANILTMQHSKLLVLASRIEKTTKMNREDALQSALREMMHDDGPQ